MATWVDFKALRRQLRFSEVLCSYGVQLKLNGERASGFCPLPGHQGQRRSPSFSVHLTRGIFQCFGCGAKGNVLDFCCRMEGLDPADSGQFRQAALKLQERFLPPAARPKPRRPSAAAEGQDQTPAVAPPSPASDAEDWAAATDSPSNEADAPPRAVNVPIDFELKHLDPGHPYLRDRGFTPPTIAHFGLGFCGRGLMKDRIAIPIHDATGNLLGYAGRWTDEGGIGPEHPKYLFPGQRQRGGTIIEFRKSLLLYNLHRLGTELERLIVVEGFASVWWLHQHGYGDAVALMGAACSGEQAQLIAGRLRPQGRVLILNDGDEAGQRCALSLFHEAGPLRPCRWLKLSAGQQPTDLDAAALARLLQDA